MFGAIEYSEGIQRAWERIALFVPRFVVFLLILFIGYFIAKGIAAALEKVLERVGFDKAIERGGIAKVMAQSKYDPSDIIAKLAFYAILLFVLQAAFDVFGTNSISTMLGRVIAYLPNVIVAVIIVVIAAAIAAAVREIIRASLSGLSYGNALGIAAGVMILGIGGFAALDQLNIAQDIVTGLFYAILAVIAGVTIVAVGGGGILPMRARWESTLKKMDDEKANFVRQASGAQQRVEQRASELRDQAKRQS